MTTSARRVPALAIGGLLFLSGCSGNSASAPPPATASLTGQFGTSEGTAPPIVIATRPADPSLPALAVTQRRVTAQYPNTTIDVVLPELLGGDPTITARINEQLQSKIARWSTSAAGTGRQVTVTGTTASFPHIGARIVSARTEAILETVPPGLAPTNLSAGDVFRLDTGERIPIEALFRDGDLTVLASTALHDLRVDPTVRGVRQEGFEPVARNFDQYTVGPGGITLILDGYQVNGVRSIDVTVRWELLAPVMDPQMLPLLTG